VVDITPPEITAVVARPVLKAQNKHDLVNVGLVATASDACSPPADFDVAVFGDEDDETPTDSDGGGIFSPDAEDIAVGTLRLRAERVDSSDGRVYLVVVSGEDEAGNTGYGCATVVVPHNSSTQSGTSAAIQAEAARAHCEEYQGMAPADFFVIGDGPPIGPQPRK
jgi:hypothetical protein